MHFPPHDLISGARRLVWLALAIVPPATIIAGDGPGPAHTHHHGHGRHCARIEGTPPPGTPRQIPHTHERAGLPVLPRDHVEPSFTPTVKGYMVGGGSPHGGSPPCWDEGTWGWDDTGLPPWASRVRLRWSHGRRYQGGTGQYAIDGPHVPDPIAGAAANAASKHVGEGR